MESNKIKPGILTSEFLGVVVSMLISAAIAFKVIPAEQGMIFKDDILQFLNIIIQIVTLVVSAYLTIKPLIVYMQGRVALKAQQLAQSQNLPVDNSTGKAQ